jgi:hypothetical protein
MPDVQINDDDSAVTGAVSAARCGGIAPPSASSTASRWDISNGIAFLREKPRTVGHHYAADVVMICDKDRIAAEQLVADAA